jgi:2-amino-4-hydroxy-6-hydroxymethyldihydropteridine diphosphokinase
VNRRAYIALGSNVGNRMAYLRAAFREIGARWNVVAVSPVYETQPVGYRDQGAFLNAVVAVDTDEPPAEMLRRLKETEAGVGRKPRFTNGPREIDLDLLLVGTLHRNAPPCLPHPRMHERAFVLRPLVDIAPDIRIGTRGSAADLLRALPEDGAGVWPEMLDAR